MSATVWPQRRSAPMRIDPLMQTWTRWFSSMDVALYRLTGNLSPLNWNKLSSPPAAARAAAPFVSTPLTFFEQDDKLYVIASFGGSDTPPAWYLNLGIHPE